MVTQCTVGASSQTNARGVETGVDRVYESSREKVRLRREKVKNMKDENERHHLRGSAW